MPLACFTAHLILGVGGLLLGRGAVPCPLAAQLGATWQGAVSREQGAGNDPGAESGGQTVRPVCLTFRSFCAAVRGAGLPPMTRGSCNSQSLPQ